MRGKVAKHRPGRCFEVYQLDPRRWQLIEIKSCRPMMPPRIPVPIGNSARALTLPPAVKPIGFATLRVPLAQETKSYIGVLIAGAIRWFGRATLNTCEIADGMVALTLPRKAIEKRGFAKLIA